MSHMTEAYGQILNVINNKAKSCLELTTLDGYSKAMFAFYYNDGKNTSEKDAFKQLCETVYDNKYKCGIKTKANKYTTALAAATYDYNKVFYNANNKDVDNDKNIFTEFAMKELGKYENYSAKQLSDKHYVMSTGNKYAHILIMSARKARNTSTNFNLRTTVMSKYLLCDTFKLDNSVDNDEIIKIINDHEGYVYSKKVNKYTIMASYVIVDSTYFMLDNESEITLF